MLYPNQMWKVSRIDMCVNCGLRHFKSTFKVMSKNLSLFSSDLQNVLSVCARACARASVYSRSQTFGNEQRVNVEVGKATH